MRLAAERVIRSTPMRLHLPAQEETAKQTLARWHAAGRLLTLPGSASDPLFYHKRLKFALEQAGLSVHSIKKEAVHDLWIVRLKARRVYEEREVRGVKEPLVQIFRRFGCKFKRSD